MSSPPIVENRVSRSHAQPACNPCRRRKSRCKFDTADATTCLLCKLHGNECVFPELPPARIRRRQRREAVRLGLDILPPPPRPGTSIHQHGPPRDNLPHASSAPPGIPSSCSIEVPFAGSPAPTSPGRDESHVIGPVQSPDAQLIADYLSNNPGVGPRSGRMIVTRSDPLHSGQRTVLFSTVRRRPLGHVPAQSLPASICEVVTKLLEPHCENLVDVYFSKVHQCFPLLDERTFRLQYDTQKEKISPGILTSLYAQAIVYWRNSSSTPNQQYPDLRFIWNKANEALTSEIYTSPGLSVIAAVLLNVSGRPLTAMIGNRVLLGSAISLAHSLGLNRNCLDWDISPSEKLLRTRLWWAIVIFDKWFSVTHGTPQQLRASQHDVPPPAMAVVTDDDSTIHPGSATCPTFEALAGLSEVLETYLDHVFNLRHPADSGDSRICLVLEKRLAQWEDDLPSDLRRTVLRGTNLSIPGSANLRLSYLYIRLLTQKLEVDNIKQSQPTNSADLDQRLMYARQAAESIVLFIQELDDAVLRDFWLSFNAFALSGTVAFLLRCALESGDGTSGVAQSRCLGLARDLIEALRVHQQRMNWDLGNICVAQYAAVLDNIAADGRPLEAVLDMQQFSQSDFAEFDHTFLNEWDMFQMGGTTTF
ncbi:fungal-specific transcription factor domain-containing protein [Xylaria palmicola]|nr:fungal-specific transcription factor domain-containing protein [Xylaria palmicola]